jgi:hypothetical protein
MELVPRVDHVAGLIGRTLAASPSGEEPEARP